MPYDEALARRVRDTLAERRDVVEKKMFGGLAFMVRGHMCCGVVGDELMVRVGPAGYADALAQPHARPMDFTGKPLKGMVYVAARGSRTQKAVAGWVERGLSFVLELPRK